MNLEDKTFFILGIANGKSIAAGAARALRAHGARLAVTYQNEKAKKYVDPVAEELGAEVYVPCDVTEEGSLEAAVAAAQKTFGTLDGAVHSIAFAPRDDLHGKVYQTSKDGFALAMDISCHSFARLAAATAPLMTNGGSLLTMTYYGSQKVVDQYGIMGPVKAALESLAMYMACDLGPAGIRVNCISPGPMDTRAASGIRGFDALMDKAKNKSASGTLVALEDIGNLAAFLSSDAAKAITGQVHYIDHGASITD
ncbi:MAG: enoyl-ACP reductase FabI [Alphaproteobacteria bacterium]|nr:enoyl-ACP reductase FabI [Alphaproteobacteria bacterium]